MSDWNDSFKRERDGLPRGYFLFDPYTLDEMHQPFAPEGWFGIELQLLASDAALIAGAQRHVEIVGALDPMDVRVLGAKYQSAMMKYDALSPRSFVTLCCYPLDAYAMPIAMAAKVFYAGPNRRVRGEAWLLDARVHGCPQESWMQMPGSVEAAREYRSTRDMDRGRAWPIDGWQCFSNGGLGYSLQLVLGNPSHDAAVDIEITVFYIGFHTMPTASTHPRCPPIGGPYR